MNSWSIATTEFAVANAVYPTVEIRAERARASALIIHGFGGSKEEQLGVALRVARLGFHASAIDLKGHGENDSPFDMLALNDINKIVEHLRAAGPEMRKHWASELYEDVSFKLLKDLPLVDATLRPTDLVLYGSRDIPEVRAYCAKLRERHAKVIEVTSAFHFDRASNYCSAMGTSDRLECGDFSRSSACCA